MIRSYVVTVLHHIEEGRFVIDGVCTLVKIGVVTGWVDRLKVNSSHVVVVYLKKGDIIELGIEGLGQQRQVAI